METFKDVISGDQLVLVDFFATWCQPCKMMHPILEQVKEVLGDRIRIIKVDVDKYGVTASQYGIQSVPTLYACSKKFAVEEDPRIDQVLDVLPGLAARGKLGMLFVTVMLSSFGILALKLPLKTVGCIRFMMRD